MIYNYVQEERRPETKHQLICNGEVIGTSECPSFEHGILYFNNDVYELEVQGFAQVEIKKNGVVYATIKADMCVTKKVLFLKIGYEYYHYESSTEQIAIYESGLGAGQHYYCFYDNQRLVAVVHKKDRVINFLDSYTSYLEEEKYFLATSLYCLFLECTENYNVGAMGNSDNSTATVTAQKELKEKFDPEFIPRIIARDRVPE